MNRRLRLFSFGMAAIIVGGVIGCQAPATREARMNPEEPSVQPGINDAFLEGDLNVSEWVERFETEDREVYAHRERIVEATEVESGDDVADIGAGTGFFSLMFAERVAPEGQVYAVEVAEEFLQHIEGRATEAGVTNLTTVLASEDSVDLRPQSIDLAFMCDVYHHLEYPESYMQSLHDALRPGGEFFLIEFKRNPGESSDWVMDHVRAGQEVFTKEIEAAGFEKVEEMGFLEENYVLRFRKTGD